MKIEVGLPDFAGLMNEIEGSIAKAATEAMRETTRPALTELREQVTSNGLGQRLANTWRDRVYPERRESMQPTGYIWSNAPEIIDSFVRGATIRPVGGGKYLWIPTRSVPRARGHSRSTSTKTMSPEEVLREFGAADFIIRKGRNGSMLAFIDIEGLRNGRVPRRATKGRAGRGRHAEPVLMFVLRRTVRMPKLLDLKGPGDRWANAFVGAFNRRLGA